MSLLGLSKISRMNENRLKQISKNEIGNLELCQIQEINIEKMTVNVMLINSGKPLMNVPFCLPAKYLDRGFLYIPEEKSLGIVSLTSKGESFLTNFISLVGSEKINEPLIPGEILMQSKGYGFIKEDVIGNVILGSLSGNLLIIDRENDIIQISTNYSNKTVAKHSKSGIINQDISDIEEIYDRESECNLSIEEISKKILNDEDVDLDTPLPVVTIEKGNILDSNGERLKLEINFNSEYIENPQEEFEMCYRITVKNQDEEEKFSLIVDKDGNIKFNGNRLILNMNEIIIE